MVERGPTISLPDSIFAPDHPPPAVHEVASDVDHESVDVAPKGTDIGMADMETEGRGSGGTGLTTTVVETLAVPPSPEHERPKLVVVDRGPTTSEPFRAFVSDQPPLAVQDVASVEVQERVEVAPEVIFVGLVERETVGKVRRFTVIDNEESVWPSALEQTKVKVSLEVIFAIVSVPEKSLVPDQLPRPEQDVAPDVIHERVTELP